MSEALCPRCGYDQSGVMAAWADRCPLEGVCTECGLAFLWRDLLNDDWRAPAWSLEHRRGWWLVGVQLRTCWAVLRPWSFWRALGIHLPIERSRLVRHAAAMLLASHLAVACASAWLAQADSSGWGWWQSLSRTTWTPADAMRARILAGLGAFAWPYPEPRALIDEMIERADVPNWMFFIHVWALLTPAAFFVLTDSLRRVPVRRRHLLRGLAYGLTPLPLATVAWVITTSEGFADTVGPWVREFLGVPWWRVVPYVAPVLLSALALWLLVYWAMFTRRYLQLPHAAGVAVAMLAIGGLAAGIVVLAAIACVVQLSWVSAP